LKYKGIDEDLIYTFLRKYGFNIKKIQEKLTAGVNSRQKFEGETGIRTSNILAIKN